jgi:hypothetical protein
MFLVNPIYQVNKFEIVTFLINPHLILWKQKNIIECSVLKEDNKMKTNESGLDRVIRVIFGIVLAILYFTNVVSGTLGIVALVIGAVLLVTGVIGFCPLYGLLKIRTNKS